MEDVIRDNRSSLKPRKRSERLTPDRPLVEMPRQKALLPLLVKYDVPAPRYTSYPPATQFSNAFESSCYLDRLSYLSEDSANQTSPPEISLYVHLPFCDTLCYFCGCTMIVSNNRSKIAEYLEYLKREITMTREHMERDVTVVQMHWGGGSPTHLTPWEIIMLGEHIRQTFTFSDDAELSIEIDPRGLTLEHIQALNSIGFNRASIGVQDFTEEVQIAINRIQPQSVTEQAIAWCRQAGMSINLDLIYGLPFQTTASFGETLGIIREIAPDRIAAYNFAYVPWIKPHQNLIEIETLPSVSTKLALLELTIQELSSAGYDYLGMDHFAQPNDSLITARREGTLHRNFQGYSTHGGKDLLAFGISAIGRVENAFAQNEKEIPHYYRRIQEDRLPIAKGYRLTDDDAVREYVIMQLMCNLKVDKRDVERLFGISFDSYFVEALACLEPLQMDGLCHLCDDSVDVSSLGRYFLRNIAAQFDAYLGHIKTERIFSRAI